MVPNTQHVLHRHYSRTVNKTFNKQEIELLIIVAWREFAISQRMIQTVRIQTLYIDFTFNYHPSKYK